MDDAVDQTIDNSSHLPQNSNPHFDALLQPLLQTKSWVTLCAILGFLTSGLMIIVGLFFILGMSAMMLGSEMDSSEMGSGIAIGMGVLYIVLGIVFAFPPLWLYRYGKSIRLAAKTGDTNDIVDALKYQKSFWKFIGIFLVIYLVFIALMLVITVAGAIFAG